MVQQDTMFASQLRAPLFEDKVVDYLFSTADVTELPSSREQLEADLESEEGHVHGPGCGHDHGAPAKPAKAKKGKAAKAEGAEARQAGQGRRRRQAGDQERQASCRRKPKPSRSRLKRPSRPSR